MTIRPTGFTLVELMIVIAIIGILAAALFPALTSYLSRGRDTSRIAGIKEISTGIAAYNVDTSQFPVGNGGAGTMCAHSGNLAKYVPKFPVDPSKQSNCTAEVGGYGYGTGDAIATVTAILSARFENSAGGNTPISITNFQGDIVPPIYIGLIDIMQKGTGSGYVIRN